MTVGGGVLGRPRAIRLVYPGKPDGQKKERLMESERYKRLLNFVQKLSVRLAILFLLVACVRVEAAGVVGRVRRWVVW